MVAHSAPCRSSSRASRLYRQTGQKPVREKFCRATFAKIPLVSSRLGTAPAGGSVVRSLSCPVNSLCIVEPAQSSYVIDGNAFAHIDVSETTAHRLSTFLCLLHKIPPADRCRLLFLSPSINTFTLTGNFRAVHHDCSAFTECATCLWSSAVPRPKQIPVSRRPVANAGGRPIIRGGSAGCTSYIRRKYCMASPDLERLGVNHRSAPSNDFDP